MRVLNKLQSQAQIVLRKSQKSSCSWKALRKLFLRQLFFTSSTHKLATNSRYLSSGSWELLHCMVGGKNKPRVGEIIPFCVQFNPTNPDYPLFFTCFWVLSKAAPKSRKSKELKNGRQRPKVWEFTFD